MDESHLIAPTVHGNTADLPTAFSLDHRAGGHGNACRSRALAGGAGGPQELRHPPFAGPPRNPPEGGGGARRGGAGNPRSSLSMISISSFFGRNVGVPPPKCI